MGKKDAPRTNGVTVPVTNGTSSSYAAKHNLPAHFIGANHLEVAPSGAVKDFVAKSDGHTVITSVCNSCSDWHAIMLIEVGAHCK